MTAPVRVAVALVSGVACVLLAGCTTTQERSATLAGQAAKAAKLEQFSVGRTNRLVRARRVVRLESDGAAAVVVRLENTSGKAQAAVPIGVDLYDRQKQSMYSNRIDGLDAALNTIPLAPPGISYWVNNQVPAAEPARVRVRVGTSRVATPADLPEMKIAKVRLGTDSGIPTATGVVRNRSSVAQLRLTIFAVALRGDRVVAAGRAVIDKLDAAGGKGKRFTIYFTGDPRGATLRVAAPPSTFAGA